MKKLLITLLAVPCGLLANSDNSKTVLQPCGQNSQCEQTVVLNAIGETMTLTIPSNQITSLGLITQEKKVTLTLPKEPGTQTAYSFTPTTGESKGQLVTIAFDNKRQRPGTRLAGKTLMRIYRRFASDPAGTWVEIGKMTYAGLLHKELAGDFKADITLKTDGTGVYMDPVKNKPVLFLAGTKDLTGAAAAEKAENAEAA